MWGGERGDVAGVVLAGGLSSRMGAEKAFVTLGGQPLLDHVLGRLAPQVALVYLNVREAEARYNAFGRPLAVDAAAWRGAGPLAGVAAAMALARARGFAWLATCPCDAPFLPRDLVARLATTIRSSGAPAAVAVGPSGWEPMFALWPTDAGPRLEAALAAGRASPRGILGELGAAEACFEAKVGQDPFANLNSPVELAAAEAEWKDERP
jgi:molybdopterin-guanine dinucleotide biosynthesis protein A